MYPCKFLAKPLLSPPLIRTNISVQWQSHFKITMYQCKFLTKPLLSPPLIRLKTNQRPTNSSRLKTRKNTEEKRRENLLFKTIMQCPLQVLVNLIQSAQGKISVSKPWYSALCSYLWISTNQRTSDLLVLHSPLLIVGTTLRKSWGISPAEQAKIMIIFSMCILTHCMAEIHQTKGIFSLYRLMTTWGWFI